MKIKKKLLEQALIEENSEEETLTDINPSEASVDEIADAIQNSVEEISDGETGVSDTSAKAAATEIKNVAKEINAGGVAFDTSVAQDGQEILGVKNALTEVLDEALEVARRGRRQRTHKNPNVLITGLPGSGKTAIIFDWAQTNNINLYAISVTDKELPTAINGITLRDLTSNDKNAVAKARSDFLDKLERENSVLFLDEFNRAPEELRRSLLSLVNEHAVSDPKGNSDKGHEFKNLLFTIAAINPSGLRYDKTAHNLNSAELSRFVYQADSFDSNVETTKDYFTKHWNFLLYRLSQNKKDEHYLKDLEDYLRTQDIGLFLIEDPRFEYDTLADYEELYEKQKTMLNQRMLTDGLDTCAGSIKRFKNWVHKFSGFLEKNRINILEILNDYEEPSLEELINKKEQELKVNLKTPEMQQLAAQAEVETPNSATVEKEEEEEDDKGLFNANIGKNVATPQEILQSIQDSIKSGLADLDNL